MKRVGFRLLMMAATWCISAVTAVGGEHLSYMRIASLKDVRRNNAVALSPNGSMLAAANRDNTVCILDSRTGTRLASLDGHEREATAVAFSSGGKRLATGGADDQVIIWDTATWKPLWKTDLNSTIITLAFSPDGSLLAVANYDNTVFLIDPLSGKKVRILKGHADDVRSIAFSGNNSLLASGGDDMRVVLWDVRSGSEKMALKKLPGKVLALAISPDGALLASGGDDGKVTVREIPSGKVLTVLEGHRHVISGLFFLDHSKVLASLERKQIPFGEQSCAVKFRSTVSWQELGALEGACAPSFSFTPNGQYLATGGEEVSVFRRSP